LSSGAIDETKFQEGGKEAAMRTTNETYYRCLYELAASCLTKNIKRTDVSEEIRKGEI